MKCATDSKAKLIETIKNRNGIKQQIERFIADYPNDKRLVNRYLVVLSYYEIHSTSFSLNTIIRELLECNKNKWLTVKYIVSHINKKFELDCKPDIVLTKLFEMSKTSKRIHKKSIKYRGLNSYSFKFT